MIRWIIYLKATNTKQQQQKVTLNEAANGWWIIGFAHIWMTSYVWKCKCFVDALHHRLISNMPQCDIYSRSWCHWTAILTTTTTARWSFFCLLVIVSVRLWCSGLQTVSVYEILINLFGFNKKKMNKPNSRVSQRELERERENESTRTQLKAAQNTYARVLPSEICAHHSHRRKNYG